MNKRNLRPLLTLCFLAGLAVIFTAPRSINGQTCDTVTDQQLVTNIYARIKADRRLAPQIRHINVVSVYAAVKLQGWADGRKDYDKVVDIAMTTKCVKLVNVNLFASQAPVVGDKL